MSKHLLVIALAALFAVSQAGATTYCLPRPGDLKIGATGATTYRPPNFAIGSRSGAFFLGIAADACVAANRTYLAIACGYNWQPGFAIPTSCTSTPSCFYADPNANTFTGAGATASEFQITQVGNILDFGVMPVFCSVKAAYNSEDPNGAPWVQVQPFFTALQASRPIEGTPVTDAAAGTTISALAACSDAETWYADSTSSLTTPCDGPGVGSACSLQGALDKVDGGGDTVLVADGTGGTYTLAVGPFTLPNFSGTAKCPIVVKAANAGAAHLAAATGGLLTIAGSRAYWDFTGFGVATVASGQIVFNVTTTGAGISIRNITDDEATMHAASKILVVANSSNSAIGDYLFENFTLDKGYTSDMVDFNNFSGPITMRGWNVDNQAANASHFVITHNLGGSLIYENNDIRDFTGLSEGAVFLYMGGENAIIRNSTFYSLPIGVLLERTGRTLVENNTFVNVNLAVNPRKRSGMMSIRNNIFQDDNAGSSIAVRFTGDGGSGFSFTETGSDVSYNSFCGFSTTLSNNSDGNITYTGKHGYGVLTRTGNCFGPVGSACGTVSTQSNCNCGLADPANGDFLTDAAGPCDDAADPNTPVPDVAGEGTRRDIGAFEGTNGTGAYTNYLTVTTLSDTGPRLPWTFQDPQNTFATLWPNMMRLFSDPNAPLETDAQANYRIQIDESPYFNSMNDGNANGPGYPIYSTTVASANEYFILSNGSLVSGHCYYWRVACTDDVLTSRYSPWSDGIRKFCIQ